MFNLKDIYQCPICLELMETAVSLNPCGHELDEGCVRGMLDTTNNKCPICNIDVNSFRPAYITRQAVAQLQQIMPDSSIIIHMKSLDKQYSIKLKDGRNCKVAKLLPLLCKHLGFSSPKNIRLLTNGQLISPFKYLSQYIPNNKSEYTFYAVNGSPWVGLAEEHPLIFKTVLTDYYRDKNSDRLKERFISLYKEALNKTLNET